MKPSPGRRASAWVSLGMLVLASASCATTSQVLVPAEQAVQLQASLRGAVRYLAASLVEAPFFGDETRRLLTWHEPADVELLTEPSGAYITPGPALAIWPVGTRARIRRIDFPSPTSLLERVAVTPRTLAWVTVELDGRTADTALTLVLRPGLQSADELERELERALSRTDPAPTVAALTAPQQEAVRARRALPEMSAEALSLAWGPPDKKVLSLEGEVRRVVWTWGSTGRRAATLLGGRVVELKP
jgi:hypothetical protein